MAKLTAEQRIEKVHVKLMRHKNFCLFSGLFMVGKVTVDEKTPTAKTNGVNVTYGREFVDSLNDKQLAFLILHENMHKAYRHLVVWDKLSNRREVSWHGRTPSLSIARERATRTRRWRTRQRWSRHGRARLGERTRRHT